MNVTGIKCETDEVCPSNEYCLDGVCQCAAIFGRGGNGVNCTELTDAAWGSVAVFAIPIILVVLVIGLNAAPLVFGIRQHKKIVWNDALNVYITAWACIGCILVTCTLSLVFVLHLLPCFLYQPNMSYNSKVCRDILPQYLECHDVH
jgi:hypothetical protein